MPLQGREDFQNMLCFLPDVEENKWGLPTIRGVKEVPEDAFFVNSEFARKQKAYDSWVTFYEYDYKFDRMWQQPKRQAKWLMNFQGAVTPQFSVYIDTPLAVQLFSIYKNRWCGAYWESLGIKVIPDVCWGDERSFEFCWDGLPRHRIVSVGAMGNNKDEEASTLFKQGFEEMCKVLEPSLVLLYGTKRDDLPDVPIRYLNQRRPINLLDTSRER